MRLRQAMTAVAATALFAVTACGASENETDPGETGDNVPTGEAVDYDFSAVTVTHLSDPDGEIWKRFGAVTQSSYAIVDPDQGLLHTGYLDGATLEEWIVYITT